VSHGTLATQGCPCGYLGHPRRGCPCTAAQKRHYLARLSGPLVDRFDLFVDVPAPEPGAMLGDPRDERAAPTCARVVRAREVLGRNVRRTASAPVRARLAQAMADWSLSGRGVARTLAVAHSIAALEGREQPAAEHVDEALSFRRGLLELRVR